MKNTERIANLALAGLTLTPLVVKINPNVNVLLTASITVFVGCYRSVKPTPPSEIMSNQRAIRFPFVGSALLLSLFLLFKFLSKDLVNAVFTLLFFVVGIVNLWETLLPSMKRFFPKQWNEDLIVWRFLYFTSLKIELTKSQVIVVILETFFCGWYVLHKHWLANNILGLVSSIQRIERCSLGSFKTGAIMLLLFLRSDSARPFVMLGLGDIVTPGMFVALALRFDVSRGKQPQYFRSAFLGYIVGLALAIVVANWFQAAQPALFYIVPAVIGFLAAHCIWNGDVKQLLAFDVLKMAKSFEEESVREPIMNPMIDEESVGPRAQKDKEQVANSPHAVEVRKSTRIRKPNPKYFNTNTFSSHRIPNCQ